MSGITKATLVSTLRVLMRPDEGGSDVVDIHEVVVSQSGEQLEDEKIARCSQKNQNFFPVGERGSFSPLSTQTPMDKGWRTGTSAESWRLRGLGRYREADELLRVKVKENDPEALMTLYWLHYPGSLSETLYGKNRDIPLSKARDAGHPVACVRLHELRNFDPNVVTKYAEESGCAAAIMENRLCAGRPIPLDLAERIRMENDPDTVFRLWDGTSLDPGSTLARHLADIHHPIVLWAVAVPVIARIWPYYSNRPAKLHTSPDIQVLVHGNLRNTVIDLETAAAQGHIDACHELSMICFNPLVPVELRDPRRGARLLTRVLLHNADNQKPTEDPSFAFLRQRLVFIPYNPDHDRLYELYCYGKVWPSIPKAENTYPSHARYLKPTGIKDEVPKIDLGDLHPVKVYARARYSYRWALITFMGCLRKRHRELGYKVPVDIIQLIGRLVWNDRERNAGSWWETERK